MRATRCPPPPSSAFPAIACSNWARRSKSRRRQAPDRILNMRCDIRSPAAHDENHAGAAVAKKFVHAAEAKPLCGVHGLTRRCGMPEKEVIERARKDKREGKSASTQAGEFVREEIDHIREGKHGARSTKQAIAIGLSEARRAGVDLPPPKEGEASRKTIKQAERDRAAAKKSGSGKPRKTSGKRSRASSKALKREGHSAASKRALS